MKRPHLLVAIVTAFGLGIGIWLLGGTPSRPNGDVAVKSAEAPNSVHRDELGPPEGRTGRKRVAGLDHRAVRGRVVVVGRSEPFRGHLRLTPRTEEEEVEDIILFVQDSGWEAYLARGCIYAPAALEPTDGTTVYLVPGQRIAPGRSGSTIETVRAVAFPCLWMSDAESGEGLTSITIHPSEEVGLGHGLDHPGLVGPTEPNSTSPVPKSRLIPGQYWVTAPGHQWRHLHVPSAEKETVTVASLGRAGQVDAHISGESNEKLTLLLRAVGGQAIASLEVSRALVSVDGLAPGDYEVLLSRYSPAAGEHGDVLDTATIRVERDERVHVSLDAAAREAKFVQVSGVVHGDVDPSRLRQLVLVGTSGLAESGTPTVLRAGERLYEGEGGYVAWDPVALLPGSYAVEAKPLGMLWRIRVPSESVYVMELEVPRRLTVTVDFVDRSTGDPARIQNVLYSVLVDPDERAPRRPGVGRALVDGTSVELEAAAAPMHVMVIDSTYGIQHGLLEFRTDSRRATFELVAPILATVSLESGGAAFLASEGWWRSFRIERSRDGVPPLSIEHRLPDAPSPLVRLGGVSCIVARLPGAGTYRICVPGANEEPPLVQIDGVCEIVVDKDSGMARVLPR